MEIFNGIIQDYEAREIAMENGIASEQEAAATWFNEVSCNGEWEEAEKKPTYSKFINTIDCGDLYYDYGAGYYFVVRESSLNEAGWKSNAHPSWKETAHAASAPLSTKTDVITRDVAARYGFKPEYTNFHGYDVWEGNLNGKEEGELKSSLGINKFVSIDHNGKVRVLVYPSDRRNVLKINENTLRKIIAESVKKVLKEGIGRNKYESEFRNAINIITSNVNCETPKIGQDKNGYSYCDIEFPSISMSLRLYCYNESTGELGARLDDEYGTNMYDYVSAAQGAPLGYIIDRTGEGLAQKIISDIQQIEKSSGEY